VECRRPAARRDAHELRPHAERERAGADALALEEVHAGAADEVGDEERGRLVVDLERRADLLDQAVLHDDDAVGEPHRLLLVLRHVERGDARGELLLAQELAHREAAVGVERAERFVHEPDRGAAHDGAREPDALLVAAGELARLLLQQLGQPEPARDGRDGGGALRLRHAAAREREGDVLGDREMGVERVELEDEADVTLGGRARRHVGAGEADRPRARQLEPGHHAQRRRLAAARRSQQHDELALCRSEVDPLHGARAVGVGLRERGELEEGHASQRSGAADAAACELTIWRTTAANSTQKPARSPPSQNGWSSSASPAAMPASDARSSCRQRERAGITA
jgi:hypothetical protein